MMHNRKSLAYQRFAGLKVFAKVYFNEKIDIFGLEMVLLWCCVCINDA